VGTARTICPYCGVGCGIIVQDLGDGIKVIPDPSHPVNKGTLCVKGWKGLDFATSPNRLTKPLLRTETGFMPITWGEAIKLAAEELSRVRREHGPDAVAFISSAKATNEENYLMQKLARAFGTNNVDHCARSCHSTTIEGLIRTLGAGAMTSSIDDLDSANVVFVIGSNTTEQHPIIGARIIRNKERGLRLVVADPRETKLASIADVWLRHRPGTDIALLNSLAHVVIEERLYDESMLDKVNGFQEYAKLVEEYSPEKMRDVTGVDPALVRRAAELMAGGKLMILYAMGITQHEHGTENVMAVADLALILGAVGREGTGVAPLRGHSNVQGSSDMAALPDFLPGYVRVWDKARKRFEDAWGFEVKSEPGLYLTEMFEAGIRGRIKAFYIMGENPAITEACAADVPRALDTAEFVIVQDLFLTETAKHATLVLPAASFLEKEGTITNTERRIQLIRKAREPPGEARPDWEIIIMVANALGLRGFQHKSPREVMSEVSGLVPQYAGVTYEALEPYGLQWPVPSRGHPGTKRLYTNGFPRGKADLVPVEWSPPSEWISNDYPFILTTGRSYYHWHSGVLTRESTILSREYPEPLIEVNNDDAEKLGVRNGDWIRVESRRGSIIAKALVTNKVPRGVVFSTFHFVEAIVNELIGVEHVDKYAKMPEYKVTPVKVSKATH